MLRFAFKPGHPITRVAFTADGREVITAQPFTGIAVRDRLTGEARVRIPMRRTSAVYALAVQPEYGWVMVHSVRGGESFDSNSGLRVGEAIGNDAERIGQAAVAVREAWRNAGAQLARLAPENPHRFGSGWGTATVAATSDGSLRLKLQERGGPMLFDGPSDQRLATLRPVLRIGHVVAGSARIEFSTDGRRLALGDGESISVFDVGTVARRENVTDPRVPSSRPVAYPILTLERPDPTQHGTHADKTAEHWLPPVAFDHSGRSLFTLGLRNRVRRIDLATGGVMAEWGWWCEPIRSLAVAPDDLTAAAGCQRGELVLWDLE